jgi:hypothetical protein
LRRRRPGVIGRAPATNLAVRATFKGFIRNGEDQGEEPRRSDFPVGGVRAENNTFEGLREKSHRRAQQYSVSARPEQTRRPKVQGCQISK